MEQDKLLLDMMVRNRWVNRPAWLWCGGLPAARLCQYISSSMISAVNAETSYAVRSCGPLSVSFV